MDKSLVTAKSRVRPNSDGRREQIVEAALAVMIAEGVYHATTRKIAQAAGVNVATLHYHFHDKEEIILSVMEGLATNYRHTGRAIQHTADAARQNWRRAPVHLERNRTGEG